jgi:hypothetical protein
MPLSVELDGAALRLALGRWPVFFFGNEETPLKGQRNPLP